MQSHNAYPDPSYSSPAAYNNGAAATLAGSAEPYIHPTIPLGLPHVVQFVEASIHHLPMSVRFVGDRLSRYANAKGEVSMAASFLCRITGLGSRNTADHHLRLIESLGVMEKRPGKGGMDRKSNTYVFQGADRSWKPLPTERPGTDPWVALARSRRENEALRGEIEELQAELARLMNGATIAHPGVTDGDGVPHPEQSSHSYETAGPVRSSEESGAIAHLGVRLMGGAGKSTYFLTFLDPVAGDSELSNGPETAPSQDASHSYETADPGGSPGESGAIAHSELSNGPARSGRSNGTRDGALSGCFPQLRNRRSWRLSWGIRSHCSFRIEQWARERSPWLQDPGASHMPSRSASYETAGPVRSSEESGAIAHSELSNGPDTIPPQETSHSYETAGPVRSSEESGAIAHSELSNGPETAPTQDASHSYETADPGGSPGESGPIAHSELSNGPETGQEYLPAAAGWRVEALVMERRGYYDRRFRGGVLSAVHHFSLNSENEDDLLRQVNVLRAGQEPSPSGAGAAQDPERAPPREEPLTESGRREVEYCPDCGSPYTTFNGEERCPDCTGRRRRESEA